MFSLINKSYLTHSLYVVPDKLLSYEILYFCDFLQLLHFDKVLIPRQLFALQVERQKHQTRVSSLSHALHLARDDLKI